jgi:hypothetical protein
MTRNVKTNPPPKRFSGSQFYGNEHASFDLDIPAIINPSNSLSGCKAGAQPGLIFPTSLYPRSKNKLKFRFMKLLLHNEHKVPSPSLYICQQTLNASNLIQYHELFSLPHQIYQF